MNLLSKMAEDTPKIGLVIGTYGAAPYIHLQLEVARRLYPEVPILVHDDASDEEAQLRELCESYGARLVQSGQRGGHHIGDVRAFAHGLSWAAEQELDVLIKFSRRLIPLYDWRGEVRRLLWDYPSPTLSSYCTTHSYGFRSEAVGLVVDVWRADFDGQPSAYQQIEAMANSVWPGDLVESWMHNHARRLHQALLDGEVHSPFLDSELALRNERIAPQIGTVNGYALWPVAGSARGRSTPLAIWHEAENSHERFEALAIELGLPYRRGDFEKHQSINGN